MSVDRMGPTPAVPANHYSEWVELHRSELVGQAAVAAEMRQQSAMLYLQHAEREREREREKERENYMSKVMRCYINFVRKILC